MSGERDEPDSGFPGDEDVEAPAEARALGSATLKAEQPRTEQPQAELPSPDLREPTSDPRDPISEVRDQKSETQRGWFRQHYVRYSILTALIAFAVYTGISIARLPSVEDLKQLAKTRPRTTALMERRIAQAAEAGKQYKPHFMWVPLSNISEDLIHAVITTEDAGFYAHNGIDWEELQISVKHDLEEGDSLRGASTITQQLAKNLYLDPTRSPLRKLREMVIARRMEDALTKQRILELYLNLIEWGPGIYGCELASQTYFGVSSAELTREQAARLAAVIASPLKHRANSDDRFVTRRTKMILGRLDAYGW